MSSVLCAGCRLGLTFKDNSPPCSTDTVVVSLSTLSSTSTTTISTVTTTLSSARSAPTIPGTDSAYPQPQVTTSTVTTSALSMVSGSSASSASSVPPAVPATGATPCTTATGVVVTTIATDSTGYSTGPVPAVTTLGVSSVASYSASCTVWSPAPPAIGSGVTTIGPSTGSGEVLTGCTTLVWTYTGSGGSAPAPPPASSVNTITTTFPLTTRTPVATSATTSANNPVASLGQTGSAVKLNGFSYSALLNLLGALQLIFG